MAKADDNRKDVVAGFRVDQSHQDKIKAIAYWERKTIKEVAGEALDEYIKKYEKKNGEVKPIPAKK